MEGASEEHDLVLMGRHGGQAPDIDGQVYLSGTEHLARVPRAGEFVQVRVTQSSDYDIAGEVLELESESANVQSKRTVLRVLPSDNRSLN